VKKRRTLRPTKSVVKGALFNILGDLRGLTFLDLFAGTGQIGLEAERRGATVLFVEKNKKLAQEIKKKTKGTVVPSDVLKFLKRWEGKADVIFADPPYAYDKYEELISLALSRLPSGGVFVLEHDKRRSFGAPEERRYGDTVLSIWVRE